MVAADGWLSGSKHISLKRSRCYSQHQGACFRSVARQGFARLSDTNMRLPLDVRAALTTAVARLDRVLGVREPYFGSISDITSFIALPIYQSKYMGSVLKHMPRLFLPHHAPDAIIRGAMRRLARFQCAAEGNELLGRLLFLSSSSHQVMICSTTP